MTITTSKQLAEALGGWRDLLVHSQECRAYKAIGRFGSRSGLYWARGDELRCDCKVLPFLLALRAAAELCEMYKFNNNAFDDAEDWERLTKSLELALADKLEAEARALRESVRKEGP